MTMTMTLMIIYVGQEPEDSSATISEGKGVEDKCIAAAVRQAKCRARKAQQETSAERNSELQAGEIDNVFLIYTDLIYIDNVFYC